MATKSPINLMRGWPNDSLLPVELLKDAAQNALSDPSVAYPGMAYGPDHGYQPFRKAMAAWLTAFYQPTAPISANRIVATGGASQNLGCMLAVFTDPEYTRNVWIVAPAYFLAFRIFEDAGLGSKMQAVPEDEEGLDIERLREEMAKSDEKAKRDEVNRPRYKDERPGAKFYRHLIYCVPTFANPSSRTMSLKRRQQLVRLAREHDALVISDDVYDFLQWPADASGDVESLETARLPRLVDIDRDLEGGVGRRGADGFGNACSNGSFSKIVGPGIRVGWAEGTEILANAISQACVTPKSVSEMSSSLLSSRILSGTTRSGGAPSQLTTTYVTPLLTSGSLRNHISTVLQPEYAWRYNAMTKAITSYLLPLGFALPQPSRDVVGGYFTWLSLPETITAEALAKRCLDEENVVIAPGPLFEVHGQISFNGHIRLCWAREEKSLLAEGVKRVAAAAKRMLDVGDENIDGYVVVRKQEPEAVVAADIKESTGSSYYSRMDTEETADSVRLGSILEGRLDNLLLKRRASSLPSASSAPPARPSSLGQPRVNSQILFGQSYQAEATGATLANALGIDVSQAEQNPDGDFVGLDVPDDILRAGYLGPTASVSQVNPHSAILVWLTRHQRGSKSARYLPLEAIATARGSSSDLHVQTNYEGAADIDHAKSSTLKWPSDKLPVEIFELIADSLARDDVMAMRLVNHEFEDKVSRTLFQTCVVPFNTELYDMIDDEAKLNTRAEVAGVSSHAHSDQGELHWLNAKDDAEGKVYKGHGLRVFQGFGPHIKRFGMSFEVDESTLSYPPIKKSLDAIESYHGRYDWPRPHYARFANLAGLERTADETSKMKAAFSNLTGVRELALSLDNGLGWLNGPDLSIRARILNSRPSVFKSARRLPSRQTETAKTFWNALLRSHSTIAPRDCNPRETILEYRPLQESPEEVLGSSRYTNTRRWPRIDMDRVMPEGTLNGTTRDVKTFGVLFSTPGGRDGQFSFDPSVKPSDLRKEQKEWLLEMDWAQRAFLESYMLAVVDNKDIFQRVTTLNIAKLSSRFIRPLANASFWDALRALEDVTLLVSADWRSVEKDAASIAETTSHPPSLAVDLFHDMLLRPRISDHPTIKRLKIGWVGGGERAEGMYARNNHILPAPITPRFRTLARDGRHCLRFRNVEHLTLTNCWISPPVLEGLIEHHACKKLRKLTLDSVSLTAHPNVPATAGAGVGLGARVAAAAAAAAVATRNFPGVNATQGQGAGLPHLIQAAMPPPLPAPTQVQAGWPAGQAIVQGGLNVPNATVVAPPAAPQAAQAQLPQAAWWLGNAGAANAGNVQPPAFPLAPPLPPRLSHSTVGHRPGSWPDILDRHSPGDTPTDYISSRQPWVGALPARRPTRLHTLELKSCGYLILNAPQSFDQNVIEPDWAQHHYSSHWFYSRATALKPLVLDNADPFMGRIVTNLTQHERHALQVTWGLTFGWSEHADDPTWDGFKPGGTGRFSGVLSQDMGTVGGAAVSRNDHHE
nr:uncharacterized protein CFP56_31015 [Quercus suber]